MTRRHARSDGHMTRSGVTWRRVIALLHRTIVPSFADSLIGPACFVNQTFQLSKQLLWFKLGENIKDSVNEHNYLGKISVIS